jgi:hypothetical protein
MLAVLLSPVLLVTVIVALPAIVVLELRGAVGPTWNARRDRVLG